VSSVDAAGNSRSSSLATSFLTSVAGVADQTRVGFRTGTPSGAMIVTGTGLADLTLNSKALPSSGQFVSRVLDATKATNWQRAVWEADVPTGATLKVSVRSGGTFEPDGSWSAWTPVTGSGAVVNLPAGQFLQYRVEMTASSAGVPTLHWIGFTHNSALPGATRRNQLGVG